jgi:hypothetical protein
MGQRLIEPGQISVDPPDFDPLEFCRGERLRAKRSERARSLRARRDSAEYTRSDAPSRAHAPDR